MIDVSVITKQIKEWFESDANLQGAIVARGSKINEDPGLATRGWIGIYRRVIDYDPRNLGVPPNNYEGDLTFDVVVQKTNLTDPEAAEDDLEEFTKNILDRLVQLPKTYLDFFSELTVEYAYLETESKTMYFQSAIITATAEFQIEVSK